MIWYEPLIIVAAVLFVVAVFTVHFIRKKKGKSTCSCGCSCSQTSGCPCCMNKAKDCK